MVDSSVRETRRRRVLVALLAAGVLLRVAMIWFPRSIDDDTAVYAELGRNLLHHGTYGFVDDGVVNPALIRLPGYPLFLALLGGHLRLAYAMQAALDLLGCWLMARFLWVWSGEKAGDVGLGLGCLCVFTSAFAAMGMTESLSVFAVAWGIWAVGETMLARSPGWRQALPVAGAAALAMLLRPDGALLLAGLLYAIVRYGAKLWGWHRAVRLGCMVGLLAILPLVPWTARNWRTFHVFQPLAPRYVNDPGEPVSRGFYRWMRTWSTEFVDTGTIFWQVGEGRLEMSNLPARAYDSPNEQAETARLFDVYNQTHTISPELDAEFGRLADARIASHPLRYYISVPALRVADMWLRPRTETFHLSAFWWRWQEHGWQSLAAMALGLMNLGYIVLALLGLRRRFVPFARWMIFYIVARSAMLATIENPEPRYTLEAYPILIVCAACWVGGRFGGRWRLADVVDVQESGFAEFFAENLPVVERGGFEQAQAGEIGGDAARS